MLENKKFLRSYPGIPACAINRKIQIQIEIYIMVEDGRALSSFAQPTTIIIQQ